MNPKSTEPGMEREFNYLLIKYMRLLRVAMRYAVCNKFYYISEEM